MYDGRDAEAGDTGRGGRAVRGRGSGGQARGRGRGGAGQRATTIGCETEEEDDAAAAVDAVDDVLGVEASVGASPLPAVLRLLLNQPQPAQTYPKPRPGSGAWRTLSAGQAHGTWRSMEHMAAAMPELADLCLEGARAPEAAPAPATRHGTMTAVGRSAAAAAAGVRVKARLRVAALHTPRLVAAAHACRQAARAAGLPYVGAGRPGGGRAAGLVAAAAGRAQRVVAQLHAAVCRAGGAVQQGRETQVETVRTPMGAVRQVDVVAAGIVASVSGVWQGQGEDGPGAGREAQAAQHAAELLGVEDAAADAGDGGTRDAGHVQVCVTVLACEAVLPS